MTPPQHLWYFTKESLRRMSGQFALSMEYFGYPAKLVPVSLIVFQLQRMLGMRGSPITAAGRIGISVNLFDAMRVVLRKGAS